MKVKEHLGDVLKQLMDAPDQMAMMEIIDNSEALNADMPEAVEGGDADGWEEKYNELFEKYKTRFTSELSNGGDTGDEFDDEIDEEVDVEDEEDKVDYNTMSYEEAGIK